MSETIAKFRFLRYRIVKSEIDLSTDGQVSGDLNVEFTQTLGEDQGECKMKLMMETKISDANNYMTVMVRSEGFFEFDKDLPDVQKDNFFRVNAPAILFPYVRAYISTLTALSGINPVILPTLNLSQR